ncbi:MAG: hypothetical protein WCD73_24770, partial [Pseudolabrys sp.]
RRRLGGGGARTCRGRGTVGHPTRPRDCQAAAQSGNLSIGGIASQVIAGGAGGAILTALIGAIKNKAAA